MRLPEVKTKLFSLGETVIMDFIPLHNPQTAAASYNDAQNQMQFLVK